MRWSRHWKLLEVSKRVLIRALPRLTLKSTTEDDAASETADGQEEPATEEVDDATFQPPTEAPYELPEKTLSDNVMESVNAKQGSMDIIANAVSALIAFVIGTGSAVPTKRESEPSEAS